MRVNVRLSWICVNVFSLIQESYLSIMKDETSLTENMPFLKASSKSAVA